MQNVLIYLQEKQKHIPWSAGEQTHRTAAVARGGSRRCLWSWEFRRRRHGCWRCCPSTSTCRWCCCHRMLTHFHTSLASCCKYTTLVLRILKREPYYLTYIFLLTTMIVTWYWHYIATNLDLRSVIFAIRFMKTFLFVFEMVSTRPLVELSIEASNNKIWMPLQVTFTLRTITILLGKSAKTFLNAFIQPTCSSVCCES